MLGIFIRVDVSNTNIERVDVSNTNIEPDERRRTGPISANPCGTDRIFPPGALHLLDVAPPRLRKRAFLAKKFDSADIAR